MAGSRRTIVLVGATSGLGRAAADQLARDGHDLILIGRDSQRVEKLPREGHRAALFGRGTIDIDFDDLNSERAYDPFVAYSRSKLANLLFSYELQRRQPTLSVWPYIRAWCALISAATSLGRRSP